MEIQQATQAVIDRQDLSHDQMSQVMHNIMTGKYSDPQIAGFLVGLRSKGETVTEIVAAAKIMRQLVAKVTVEAQDIIDTCGTGGDGLHTFNISTTVAFVAAAAGVHVAKHGNRSVSGKCGSADVLEAAGVKLSLTPDQIAQCIAKIGIGFMFAPMHHNAMKHAINARRAIGVRTIFNILGPLTNPAGAKKQVLGVFSKDWLNILTQVLSDLGSERVMIVHAEDGMDEISITTPTWVSELKDNAIKTYSITPEQFGIKYAADHESLMVQDTDQSKDKMYAVLDGQHGEAHDITVLNAGATIYTAGVTETLAEGIEVAKLVIKDGLARSKLDQLIKLSNTFE